MTKHSSERAAIGDRVEPVTLKEELNDEIPSPHRRPFGSPMAALGTPAAGCRPKVDFGVSPVPPVIDRTGKLRRANRGRDYF
jgi:hypothetical protein